MADAPARKGLIYAELDAIKARLDDLESALGALLDEKTARAKAKAAKPKNEQKADQAKEPE